MKKFDDQIKDDGNLNQITKRLNHENEKNMHQQDIYNYNAKIRKIFCKPKEEAFTELIDELKTNVNKTVEASIDPKTNVRDAVFFMT